MSKNNTMLPHINKTLKSRKEEVEAMSPSRGNDESSLAERSDLIGSSATSRPKRNTGGEKDIMISTEYSNGFGATDFSQ